MHACAKWWRKDIVQRGCKIEAEDSITEVVALWFVVFIAAHYALEA